MRAERDIHYQTGDWTRLTAEMRPLRRLYGIQNNNQRAGLLPNGRSPTCRTIDASGDVHYQTGDWIRLTAEMRPLRHLHECRTTFSGPVPYQMGGFYLLSLLDLP